MKIRGLKQTESDSTNSEKKKLNGAEIYANYQYCFNEDEPKRKQYKTLMENKQPISGDKFSDIYAAYIPSPSYQLPAYVETIKKLIEEATIFDDEALYYIFSKNILIENQSFDYSVIQSDQTHQYIGQNFRKTKIVRERLSLFEHIIITELQTKDDARGSFVDIKFFDKEIALELFTSLLQKGVSATRILLSSPAYETEYYRKNDQIYFHPLNIIDIRYYYPTHRYPDEALATLTNQFFQELRELFEKDATTKKDYLKSFLKAGDGHFIALVKVLKSLKVNHQRYSFQEAIELLLTEGEEDANHFKHLANNHSNLFLSTLLVKDSSELKDSSDSVQSLFDACTTNCVFLRNVLQEMQHSVKHIIPHQSFLESNSPQRSLFENKLMGCENFQDLRACLCTFPYDRCKDALIDILMQHLFIGYQNDKPSLEILIGMIHLNTFFPDTSDEAGRKRGGRFMPIQEVHDNNPNKFMEGVEMTEMKQSDDSPEPREEIQRPRIMG